ncbi:MAG: YceI family protein, partial [Bacteroidia bacterium]|nr:YceI family protein [Bacteroidia bacterium]
KGTIVEDVDLSKDGTYEVTWKGDLTLHGVTQPREIKGTITVKGGKITIHAVFNVKIEDHKIEVPSIVIDNIAEVVEVTFDATHELHTK